MPYTTLLHHTCRRIHIHIPHIIPHICHSTVLSPTLTHNPTYPTYPTLPILPPPPLTFIPTVIPIQILLRVSPGVISSPEQPAVMARLPTDG